MRDYSVIFPNYTIGEHAYDKVKEICPRYGNTAVVIGGKTALAKAKTLIIKAVETSGIVVTDFVWFGGEAAYENIDLLKTLESVTKAAMIFAVGGGKAIDTCKILAHQLHKPFFTFPTIASNCACLTSLGVAYYTNGLFRELSFSKIPPVHAFICTTIAVEAPKQYLWAGMGDTIAKYYEANISARSVALSHSNAIGVTISKMCADPILKYGAAALDDNERQSVSEAFEEVLLAIMVSTAMVSNFVEQNFNGHIAHAIFCTITMLPQIEEKHLHGEVVAYGVLVLLMCDRQKEELARVFAFCKSVGLPTKLADIDVTLEEMDKVLTKTEASPELVRTPYKVTKAMLYQAVVDLEDYNQGQ